jgi:hypothetical protein
MHKILFFFNLTIFTACVHSSQIDTTKKSIHKHKKIKHVQWNKEKNLNKEEPAQFPYSYEILPQEIQHKILYLTTNHPSTKLKETASTTRSLACVNKYFNTIINQPKFNDELIHNLSIKYRCSHETVAWHLQTKQSKYRLDLQLQLKSLCCMSKDYNLVPLLRELISEGANLEFTYNHEHRQKTPLMMSMSYDNDMWEQLLTHGANINGHNGMGITPLHYALNPINPFYCLLLITNSSVNINQQNKHEETPLLYLLKHIKKPVRKGHTRHLLMTILENLFAAGANPKIANQQGLKPLGAAKKLHMRRIVRLIRKQLKAQ